MTATHKTCKYCDILYTRTAKLFFLFFILQSPNKVGSHRELITTWYWTSVFFYIFFYIVLLIICWFMIGMILDYLHHDHLMFWMFPQNAYVFISVLINWYSRQTLSKAIYKSMNSYTFIDWPILSIHSVKATCSRHMVTVNVCFHYIWIVNMWYWKLRKCRD